MTKYIALIAYPGCTEPGCCTSFYEKEIFASSLEEAETLAEQDLGEDSYVCDVEEVTDGGHNG